MKRFTTVFALSATALLFGCGGAPGPAPIITTSSTTPVTPPIPVFTGNWQISAASTVSAKPPLTFAGSISQTGSTVSAALHVDGSNCFNQVTTMGLTGTVTADGISMTSTAVDGQVVTLAGNYINATSTATYSINGTYSISGGCDVGDQGTFTGVNVDVSPAVSWGGLFTSSTLGKFNVSGDFGQNTTSSSDGSFGLTGTATFDSPCFSAATLSPGSFPSGSFILGTLLSIEIKTNNGTITLVGTVDPLTEYISGTYTVVGGTCDQTGTAVVTLSSPWDD